MMMRKMIRSLGVALGLMTVSLVSYSDGHEVRKLSARNKAKSPEHQRQVAEYFIEKEQSQLSPRGRKIHHDIIRELEAEENGPGFWGSTAANRYTVETYYAFRDLLIVDAMTNSKRDSTRYMERQSPVTEADVEAMRGMLKGAGCYGTRLRFNTRTKTTLLSEFGKPLEVETTSCKEGYNAWYHRAGRQQEEDEKSLEHMFMKEGMLHFYKEFKQRYYPQVHVKGLVKVINGQEIIVDDPESLELARRSVNLAVASSLEIDGVPGSYRVASEARSEHSVRVEMTGLCCPVEDVKDFFIDKLIEMEPQKGIASTR